MLIRLQTSQLKEGMCVAEDVMTSDGRILLKKGSELSSPFIQKLTLMNLDEIPIERVGEEGKLHGDSNGTLPEIRALVERKFEGLPTTPIIEGLMALAQKHLQEMCAEKDASLLLSNTRIS